MELPGKGQHSRHYITMGEMRMYDVDCKQLICTKNMYINSLPCIRIKRGENESFRISGSLRQKFLVWLGL